MSIRLSPFFLLLLVLPSVSARAGTNRLTAAAIDRSEPSTSLQLQPAPMHGFTGADRTRFLAERSVDFLRRHL